MGRHPHTEQALQLLLRARAHAAVLVHQSRAEVIELAFSIAKKYVQGEIDRHPELLTQLYERVQLEGPHLEGGTLFVCARDVSHPAVVQTAAAAHLSIATGSKLEPGECRVVFDETLTIDASFAALRRALPGADEESTP